MLVRCTLPTTARHWLINLARRLGNIVVLAVFTGIVLLLIDYAALLAADQRLHGALAAGLREAELPQASPYSVRRVVRETLPANKFGAVRVVVKIFDRPCQSTAWFAPGDRVTVHISGLVDHRGWVGWLLAPPAALTANAAMVVR